MLHVLIADDDPVYRQLLETLLKQWNFRITLVCNGQEAMDAIERDPSIQLAVLDWNMPVMDGYEVCRQVKSDLSKNLYIILITGSRYKDEIINVLVAGADDYILKPFDAMDLKIRVRSAMRIINLEKELNSLRAMAL